MFRTVLIVLLGLGASLALPAAGLAQGAAAPPGLSAADEYLETAPTAGGNRPVGGNGQAPNLDDPSTARRAARSLPASTLGELKRRGKSGRAAAALAGDGAPAASGAGGAAPTSTASRAEDASARAPSTARIPLEKSEGGGPLAAIGQIVTGSGDDGIGALFPLGIVLGTLAVAGGAYRRRRFTA